MVEKDIEKQKKIPLNDYIQRYHFKMYVFTNVHLFK